MYIPQTNNQRQVPVRLSSVNFEGVFTSSRLNMENLISQNMYNNTNVQAPIIQPQQVQQGQQIRANNTVNAINLQGSSKGTPGQQNNNRK